MKDKEVWLKNLNYFQSKEIGTFTINNSTKRYFKVDVVNEHLIISKSESLKPTCNINVKRTITYKQFEEIYNLYERYKNREKGIRKQMRDLNNNATYIISIINEILG
ncbi:hypothetical protein [Clostridium sp.]|uniref:hypothetical protein n=1 Tax=Clostridium sp. TaxID=1506 RepID=UPI0026032671|nr:hypothetical protein [Clostridium sp.]